MLKKISAISVATAAAAAAYLVLGDASTIANALPAIHSVRRWK